MKNHTGWVWATAVAVLAGAMPAHAVVLQQKWVAGQQLGYDVDFDGTLNLVAPPDAPVLWAGVPLEVQLKGKSATVFDTIAVDDFGTGTVATRVEQMNVKAAAFGQKGEFVVKDGHAAFSINGQPFNEAPREGVEALSKPRFALLISRRGHVDGLVPLKGTAPEPGKTAPEAPQKKPAAGAPNGTPIDWPAVVQTFISRALPAVWPERDVQPGDTWTGDVRWTANQTPNAKATDVAPAIGTFKFVLRGEEEVAGRKLHRVAVDGAVDVDARRAAELAPKSSRPGQPPAGSLTGAHQKVVGSLWVDADAGQVVRVELNLQANAKGKMAPQPQNKTANDAGGEGQFDFVGNLRMQLRRVAMAPAPANR